MGPNDPLIERTKMISKFISHVYWVGTEMPEPNYSIWFNLRPGSVIWLAAQAVKNMLSVGEITLKNLLHWKHRKCNFGPKSIFHLHISPFSCLTVSKQTFQFTLDSYQNIMLWPCCTQAAGITLGTGAKCSESTHRYTNILPSLDSLIDDMVNMVLSFSHFVCQFCQFVTILSMW